nr:hypothetical protein [Bradyrhizobium sp. th.b2]
MICATRVTASDPQALTRDGPGFLSADHPIPKHLGCELQHHQLSGRGNPGADAAALVNALRNAAAVIAADDDRITILSEARNDTDVSATAAAHGHDGSDLRGDLAVSLPGSGAVVDILSLGHLPEERGAPQRRTHADLVSGVANELASALHEAAAVREAVLRAGLESAEEATLLLRFNLDDALYPMMMRVMAMVVPWAGLSGRKRHSEDRGADERRGQFSQG